MGYAIFYCSWGDKHIDLAEELLERNFIRWRFRRSRQRIYIDVYLPLRRVVDTGADVIFIVNGIQSAK